MPARSKYLRNPGFGILVANPKKRKKRRAKKRNPAKSKPGIFVIRKATRKNPVKKRTQRRRPRSKKRRNPLKVRHALVMNPKRRRRARRARNVRRRNPRSRRSERIILLNPMKTRRRRSRSRRRNRAVMHRNPVRRSHRRRSRRMRNPIGVVNDLFNPNMLAVAGGVVLGNIGTQAIMNRILTGGANGQRMFDLPGVNYTVAPNQFYAQNAWVLAFYKLGIGAGAWYLLRNQSPRLANGIAIGAVAGGISDVLKNTGVLQNMGVGRYFRSPNGTGSYLPGVPTQFTGPASSFLQNGVPRPGMGDMVNRKFTSRAASAAVNPYATN